MRLVRCWSGVVIRIVKLAIAPLRPQHQTAQNDERHGENCDEQTHVDECRQKRARIQLGGLAREWVEACREGQVYESG